MEALEDQEVPEELTPTAGTGITKHTGSVKENFIEKFPISFKTILPIGILIFTTMTMKIKKSQLESLIKEAVEAQVGPLNEEELEELFGGLKNLFGTGAKAVAGQAAKAGSAIKGAAVGAGQAVAGQAARAGQAIQGAAAGAAGAVKGAYQAGEKTAAMQSVKKSIQSVVTAVDQALQKVSGDQNATHDLENVKAAVSQAGTALAEAQAKHTASKPRSIQEKRSSSK